MGSGDAGMEDIWHWDADGPRIAFKGPTGNSGRQAECTLSSDVLSCRQ